MDWIEQIFHLSPDGGNGSTELLFALAAAGIVVLAASAWVRRHRRSRALHPDSSRGAGK
jgi:hypothetical protein